MSYTNWIIKPRNRWYNDSIMNTHHGIIIGICWVRLTSDKKIVLLGSLPLVLVAGSCDGCVHWTPPFLVDLFYHILLFFLLVLLWLNRPKYVFRISLSDLHCFHNMHFSQSYIVFCMILGLISLYWLLVSCVFFFYKHSECCVLFVILLNVAVPFVEVPSHA
jgi:hypothetical protein